MEYSNLEEAKEAVRRNYAWGVVYVGHNYSEALVRRLGLFQVSDDDVENAMVNVQLDMSGKISPLLKKIT